ncbi:MAG: hypothetical protein AAF992_16550 [Bacteroidota bacterium]
MKMLKENPIVIIPLALLLAFLVFPLLEKKPEKATKQAAVATEQFPHTGFLDYDLLPTALKQRMEELKQEDTLHQYYFYYFFETDDINRHFYLDDDPMNTIFESQLVTNQEALQLVEERMVEGKERGFSRINHPNIRENIRDRETAKRLYHQQIVHYVFPEYEADFRQLRVGILGDTIDYMKLREDEIVVDSKTYHLAEVDTQPQPVRGKDYFHNALRKYLKEQLVYFQFYDMAGAVHAEFTVGGKASSPQIIEGFSTRETDRDEAYKLDGLIVKALNNLKVRWNSGRKNGRNVNTRVAMHFNFSFDESGGVEVNCSELYPATKAF